VASVDFTYRNSFVIFALREKGEYIKWHEWKKLNELNKDLTKQVKEDLLKYEQEPCMLDPVSAFISMESEEHYNKMATMPEI
jgi:hypothetical protein